MPNQVGNVLGSIIIVALASVALSKKSDTANVLSKFWSGFGGALTSAGKAGQ